MIDLVQFVLNEPFCFIDRLEIECLAYCPLRRVLGICHGFGFTPISEDELDGHLVLGNDLGVQPAIDTALPDVVIILGSIDVGINRGGFEVL